MNWVSEMEEERLRLPWLAANTHLQNTQIALGSMVSSEWLFPRLADEGLLKVSRGQHSRHLKGL